MASIAAGVAVLSATAWANAVFPAGNFTIYGAVKTWGSDYFAAQDGVTVMAVKTNGTVLASSKVFDAVECDGDGSGNVCNYRLTVPLSTSAGDKTAVEGEPLYLVIVSATSTYRTVGTDAIVVSGAGEQQLVGVTLATDDDGDGVADQYVAELAVDMYAYGYDRYDKDADWDEDGQTNYQEYLAGTNPFDAEDRLVLTFFSSHAAGNVGRPDGYTFPISFYAQNGRTYTVVGTGSLATNELGRVGWTNETFVVNDEVTVSSAYPALRDASTVFWLVPVGNQHFWKLLVDLNESGVKVENIGEGK